MSRDWPEEGEEFVDGVCQREWEKSPVVGERSDRTLSTTPMSPHLMRYLRMELTKESNVLP